MDVCRVWGYVFGVCWYVLCLLFFFFFNDTATTEIYTLSLHDALPILWSTPFRRGTTVLGTDSTASSRSEEHTSELQSRQYLVCRLLLEKKKQLNTAYTGARGRDARATTDSEYRSI